MAYSYSIGLYDELSAYKPNDLCQMKGGKPTQDWLRAGDPELVALVLLRKGQELFGYFDWAEELSRLGGIQACGLLAL